MKIGFALEPCVCDILLGDVETDDVAFILVDYHFTWNNQPDDLDRIVGSDSWLNQFGKDEVYDAVDTLHFAGKLVPTSNGEISPGWLPFWSSTAANNKNKNFSLWCEVIVSPDLSTPAVKQAWDNYQIISGLCK